MGVNSLPKTVIRQCRGCDLNPGLCAPESSTLTTRPPSHPTSILRLHWRLAVEIYDVTYNRAERKSGRVCLSIRPARSSVKRPGSFFTVTAIARRFVYLLWCAKGRFVYLTRDGDGWTDDCGTVTVQGQGTGGK